MENTPAAENPTLPISHVIDDTQKPTSKKNIKVLALIVLLILIPTLFISGFFLGKTLDKNKSPEGNTDSNIQITNNKNYKLAGVLIIKEGTVELEDKNGNWKSLDKGQQIVEGDQVRTGSESKAVFEIDDGSSVRFDEDTEAQFSALTDSVILITQLKGRVYHRVQPGALVYNVKSLNVLATALGTKFSVTSNAEDESTEVAVFENSVQITAKGEETKTDTAKEGEKATYDSNSKKLALSKLSETEQSENFYEWNKTLNEDKEPDNSSSPAITNTPTPKPTLKPNSNEPASGTIVLSASAGAGKVTLNWTLNGSAPYGFKVLSSRNSDPTYPTREGDQAVFVSSDNKSYTWSGLNAGTTYHFRVGIYNSGKIVSYSNNVSATPTQAEINKNENYATAVNLTGESPSIKTVTLNWTISGGEAPHGFKIVYSNNPGPTYPTRAGDSFDYKNDPTMRSWTRNPLTSGSTYYFRVGVYDGAGHIVTYSNEVSAVIK